MTDHPESAATRQILAAWLPRLDAEVATPAALLAVSHSDPGRVVICTPAGTSLRYLRELLEHGLREVGRIEGEERERLAGSVPVGCTRTA